jgi:hypothetical protein
VAALATPAWDPRRSTLFRNELFSALEILDRGYIELANMRGSWAGAMGQPQFMPSNLCAYAVDFSGDGKRDIWNNVPDVLGSMGNYLKVEGWTPGLPWGFEVIVPDGFDTMRSRGTFSEWAMLGFKRADGGKLPDAGDAILFFPSGAAGPAFLVTRNFNVIKLYNNSDAYSLSVGHLGDRIGGGARLRAAWPANDRQLSREQRIGLQKRMAELGYKVRDFQGRIDFLSRAHGVGEHSVGGADQLQSAVEGQDFLHRGQPRHHRRVATEPGRVPMHKPSSAVNPKLLSRLFPFFSAQTLAPLPRCATITRPEAISGAASGNTDAMYSNDKPWKP